VAPCSHFAIAGAYTALREPASGGGHFDERRANCGWFRDPLACLSEAVGRLGRARRSQASARRDPATRISRFALYAVPPTDLGVEQVSRRRVVGMQDFSFPLPSRVAPLSQRRSRGAADRRKEIDDVPVGVLHLRVSLAPEASQGDL
jgi:hypothetical protein